MDLLSRCEMVQIKSNKQTAMIGDSPAMMKTGWVQQA
jgi:hypothetical protein